MTIDDLMKTEHGLSQDYINDLKDPDTEPDRVESIAERINLCAKLYEKNQKESSGEQDNSGIAEGPEFYFRAMVERFHEAYRENPNVKEKIDRLAEEHPMIKEYFVPKIPDSDMDAVNHANTEIIRRQGIERKLKKLKIPRKAEEILAELDFIARQYGIIQNRKKKYGDNVSFVHAENAFERLREQLHEMYSGNSGARHNIERLAVDYTYFSEYFMPKRRNLKLTK